MAQLLIDSPRDLIERTKQGLMLSAGWARVGLTFGDARLREAALNELASSIADRIANPPAENDLDEEVRYQARSRVKLALNDLIDCVTFSGRKKRWTVGMADRTRTITFTRNTGNVGFEFDWLEGHPERADVSKPVMAVYMRRRASH